MRWRAGSFTCWSAASALAYGVLRFGVEIWRDEPRFTPWQLTRGQMVSVPMVLAAVGLWFAIDGPPSPVRFELSALAHALPAALLVALMTFAACGYHRKEVGRW